ncbi:hypothetical protein NX801_09355 [Streptomyces sp. LP05-1]|uniref:Integral membrane protein n=1 Tax=Streptomyces pyxinae TaxID=2970734 RepID=A0ABT2CGX9_9ACTN|nr:hypothetical protein [Streptomyces sp. LP05-1]MCS0635869.1 hypothetical protein [Streptomyces sp. LP05-1]
MRLLFQVTFAVATLLEIVLIAVLIRRSVRKTSPRRTVSGGEWLSAAGYFAGPMVIVQLLVHGWDTLHPTDIALFAATFGLVTAALTERLRPRHPTAALATLTLPAALGLLGGLVGPGL